MEKVTSEIRQGISFLHQYLGEDATSWLKVVDPKDKEVVAYEFPLPEDYLGVSRVLRISFCEGFPTVGLRLQISPSPWLLWPHAMPQSLCLYGFGEHPAANSAESVVNDALKRLSKILELVLPSSSESNRNEEFYRELASYWGLQLKSNNHQLVVLEHPSTNGELFGLTDQRNGIKRHQVLWLASQQQTIEKHLSKILNRIEKVSVLASVAYFIRLNSYPTVKTPNSLQVFDWIKDHISSEDYWKLIEWDKRTHNYPIRWLLLELPNTDPPIIKAITLKHKGIKNDSRQIYGKRAGRRLRVQQDSNIKLTNLELSSVHLLANNIIHSRNIELANNDISGKKVAVIGAGSLGSSVVMHLVRAGIMDITIVDPDRFESANLGRHILGVDDLGKYKTEALKERIQKDLSYITTTSIPQYIQYEYVRNNGMLDEMDVVVITTADWNSEEFVWLLHEVRKPKWALIQAWAEPHAIIGHVLITRPNSIADGRNLFDEHGRFLHRYSEWKDNGVIPLPGCGEAFIPGGPIGIHTIASITAQSVLDVLTGKVESEKWVTSIGDIEKIRELYGMYIGPNVPEGCKQIVISREWPKEHCTSEL
ncbi:ThiF family adenylyltransferase [Acinetobacter modestus]|uniref:HesA/MoeB/ThiF family protein n=1 Tax=Acinetobacter modestus TaxID=1776740 RepID=UPI001F4A9871|nr:ThiF family adenylyltransferase [Acinetobacter modestus]MCH7388246.1 ThiF family adenylyltransferase [Acinetobacter modestus]